MNKDDRKQGKDDRKLAQGGQGSGQQQQQSGEGKQYGEGNYKATRQYNEGLKEHMQHHDIEKEAREAAPGSESEEQEMQQAERAGRSKSRGEGSSPDGEPRR